MTISKEQREDIFNFVMENREKVGIAQVAAGKFNVTAPTVYKIMKERGINKIYQPKPLEIPKDILRKELEASIKSFFDNATEVKRIGGKLIVKDSKGKFASFQKMLLQTIS